ncbi:MAG: phytanoyl-CoA dioxygenase family protein [Pseudomonadota bacterium]
MNKLDASTVDALAEQIRQDGYAIMENAIPADFRAEICAELDRLEQVRPGGDIPPGPFTGQVTRRWFDLLNDGDVWQRVAIHPWILQVLPRVLGEGFLLSTMGSAVVGDGEPAQPIHVDDGVYAFPRPHPNLVCNTMWALSDFTEAAGATRVVPGSNNWDRDPDMTRQYDSIPVEMPAGSIAFVVGTCYHGAGHNHSGKDRVALTINYCNGSMRQQENLMLSVHPARMMTFPRELQDILGFKQCKGAGHMFAQDPRLEMERHYGELPPEDPYLNIRNELHNQRMVTAQQRREQMQKTS